MGATSVTLKDMAEFIEKLTNIYGEDATFDVTTSRIIKVRSQANGAGIGKTGVYVFSDCQVTEERLRLDAINVVRS